MGDLTPISKEQIKNLCTEPDSATQDFKFTQTMYRIKDPKKSLPFYTGVLGMRLYQMLDFPEMKFSLYFLGFCDPKEIVGELGSKERTVWAMGMQAAVELTHNWGTEEDADFKYHNGNSEPKGFGHIGIVVPDVDAACERFEKLAVNFIKRPLDGKMKTIAFITDPDGYWIEILNNNTV